MHTRTIDLARTAACWREPADDRRKVSALTWLIPQAAFWIVVGAAVM